MPEPFEIPIDDLGDVARQRFALVTERLTLLREQKDQIAAEIKQLVEEERTLKRMVNSLTPRTRTRATQPTPSDELPREVADDGSIIVPMEVLSPEGLDRLINDVVEPDEQDEAIEQLGPNAERTDLHVTHIAEGQIISWEPGAGDPPEVTEADLAPLDVRGKESVEAPPFRPTGFTPE